MGRIVQCIGAVFEILNPLGLFMRLYELWHTIKRSNRKHGAAIEIHRVR